MRRCNGAMVAASSSASTTLQYMTCCNGAMVTTGSSASTTSQYMTRCNGAMVTAGSSASTTLQKSIRDRTNSDTRRCNASLLMEKPLWKKLTDTTFLICVRACLVLSQGTFRGFQLLPMVLRHANRSEKWCRVALTSWNWFHVRTALLLAYLDLAVVVWKSVCH